MSKSWAELEEEFEPSPPRNPVRAQQAPPTVHLQAPPPPPVVTRIEQNKSSVPYLKSNRFEAGAAPASRPPSSSKPLTLPAHGDERKLWEPAGEMRRKSPMATAGAQPKWGKFELQLKNVPPSAEEEAMVRTHFSGMQLTKLKRHPKSGLIFVEFATRQALDQAMQRKLPEGWEVRRTEPKQQQQQPQQRTKPAPAVPVAPVAAAPAAAPKPRKAAKAKEVVREKRSVNAFAALLQDDEEEENGSDKSEASGSGEEEE